MSRSPLHAALRRGDYDTLCALLAAGTCSLATLSERDDEDRTLLGLAVTDPKVPMSVVTALLTAGAHADSALSQALRAGQPDKIAALLAAGADARYVNTHGYGALLHAVHGRPLAQDPHLLRVLNMLITAGAPLHTTTEYCESPLRAVAGCGRYDAVALLLDAGADARQLRWTPLHYATALGTLDDIRAALDAGYDTEVTDFWQCTPLHLALLAGDVDKARLLVQRGARLDARCHHGQSPLSLALESGRTETAQWLLAQGADLEQPDDSGDSPLVEAAQAGHLAAVRWLLAAGARVQPPRPLAIGRIKRYEADRPPSALSQCQDGRVAVCLLEAGADPADLQREARREILGFPGESGLAALSHLEDAHFAAGWRREFGRRNPDPDHDPFRLAMIRAGVSGYNAAGRFKAARRWNSPEPVWSAQRFGQSLTALPDGRWVQIGGEHEDSYDPDFCIYNDVFVHAPDGEIQMYRYPQAVFPPTDFHTATLVGRRIVLIGRLGYHGMRQLAGHTPVHALDLDSFRIEALDIAGTPPGWIYKHRAVLSADGQCITVSGGVLATAGSASEGECHVHWAGRAVLDLLAGRWLP